MSTCAACGSTNPDGFRFCGSCGAALAPESPPREVRKTVTLLFCDVSGSTALGERLDPETTRRVMRRYFEEIETVVRRHGGIVEKFVGDAVMAVFGIPRVEEDDALRAVRAAAEVRERLPAVAAELGVALVFRTGVNTGEVVVGEGQTLATGDAVNVAARLEQAAEPGEILLGAETRRLVQDAAAVEELEPLELKGKAEPVRAFRLVRVDPAAPARARRHDTPFVGRGRELQRLDQDLEHAFDERSCLLVTVLGAAGVGKSRLVAELLAGVEERAHVVRGRCLHYGEAITFFPIVSVLLQLGETAGEALALVSDGVTAPNELFLAVRRTFEAAAAERPLVVVVDDIQWAEPMLLDLLDHVAELSRDAPLVLLCLARPELLDDRPGWGGGKLNATTLLLEPLADADADDLLRGVAAELDASARRRIAAAGEGNPLFLEEMAALVRETGELAVPPTIRALIAARLERLGAAERRVLECGAVEGKGFHADAVRELVPAELRPDVDAHLAALVRKDLVRPDRGVLADGGAFRFRHQLIRDTAYDALPKQARAELHEAFAGWLERRAPALIELDEIAGWHLEQAVRYRHELGLDEPEGLRRRAAERLLAAGRRAASRMDIVAAEKLLSRAVDVCPPGEPPRGEAAARLAQVLVYAGERDRSDELLREAEADPAARDVAIVGRCVWLQHYRPLVAREFTTREVGPLVARLRERGDDAALAEALLAQGLVLWADNRAVETVEAWGEAAACARRAGMHAPASRALAQLSGPTAYGPDPPPAMAARAHELEADGSAIARVGALLIRGELARMEGRFDAALAARREYADGLRELGWTVLALGVEPWIELTAGDARAAAAVSESSYDALLRLGEASFRGMSALLAALAWSRVGDVDAAERWIDVVEREAPPDDVSAAFAASAARARVAAARGDDEGAERHAREAIAHAERTDFPRFHAEAWETLADAHRAAGRDADSNAAAEQAIAIHEAKGDRANAARIRAGLAALHAHR